jgi:hypothetical protein
MEIINRYLLVILVMICTIFPSVSFGGDYLYLDKRGKVKGWAIDDGDTVRFFDKSLKPSGFYDRDTNTTFDKNSRPSGTIYDFDRDE